MKELTKICREIASHYGYAQDIEWSIRKNKIYILQTRPVTSLPDPATAKGTKIVWDNSNIQESYNGVTTPLTFSFANRAYRDVYTQTMKVLKVTDKQIKDHEYVLANLLGLVKGRVYYNINNWYRGLLLAPSFKTNKADMERMMGLSDPVDFVKDTESSLLEKLIKMPRMLLILFSMLNSFYNIRTLAEGFFAMFNKYYKKVDRKTLHELEVPELIELSMELHQGIFPSWSPPIINDFYVMMMNGKVARRLSKLGLENPIALQKNLMAGEENIESTEPTKYLLSMTELVREDKELEAIFSQNTDSQIMPLLKSSFPKFHELAQNYIELYGDRCIGELKLESITMREDPSFMFAVIRNFLKNQIST